MAATSFSLILFLLAGGGIVGDAISLLDADAYFQARSIEVKLDKMVELAGKEPSDGKAQIAQLLAIRWLGEHAADVKKDAKARALLEQIAQGKKAQDPQGFARDYAERALARLDGKTVMPAAIPKHGMLHALEWFPDGVHYFGALDLRGAAAPAGDDSSLRKLLARSMGERERDEFFKALDELGNVRVNRVSFAYRADAANRKKDQIFIRITGKGDPKRIAALFSKVLKNAVVRADKGPKDVPITFIESDVPPVIAIVGDSDILFAGYDGNDEKHQEVMDLMLAALRERKPNVVTGPFNAALKTVPAHAYALAMGELPKRIREEIARDLPAVPVKFHADAVRDKELDFRFFATMENADDAQKLVAQSEAFRKLALQSLKEVPKDIKIKQETLDLVAKAINGVKVEAREKEITGRLSIPLSLFGSLAELVEQFMMRR